MRGIYWSRRFYSLMVRKGIYWYVYTTTLTMSMPSLAICSDVRLLTLVWDLSNILLKDQNQWRWESRSHTRSSWPVCVALASRVCRTSPFMQFQRGALYGCVKGRSGAHHGQDDNPRHIQGRNNFYSQRSFSGARATSNGYDARIGPGRRIMSPLHLGVVVLSSNFTNGS